MSRSQASVLALALVALSGWTGFQIGTSRDPIAWVFLVAIPTMIVVGLALFVRGSSGPGAAVAERVEDLSRRVAALEEKLTTYERKLGR